MRSRLLVPLAPLLLSLALAFGLAACSGDGPSPTPEPAPAGTPQSTAAPAPEPTEAAAPAPEPPDVAAPDAPEPSSTTTAPDPTVPPAAADTEVEEPPETVSQPSTDVTADNPLLQYSAEHAGGPGAIFTGDPMQLIGPPPHEGLMFQLPIEVYTQLSLAALFGAEELGLPSQMFIFTSDYYRALIEKANLTNPTELTSSGENIEIQHACIARTLPTCVLIQTYWAPNLARRTNGQVKLSVVSYPELGLAGPDTLDQVSNGTLEMADIYSGYVAGVVPGLEIASLWGSLQDWETSYEIVTAVAPDIDEVILSATGGSQVLNRNWFPGADQWFFTNKLLRTLEDFEGVKIRSHGAAMSNFIVGMGAEPVFLGPGDLYVALELGQVDAITTTPLLALPERLYEVADYMAGPVAGFGYTMNVINQDVWGRIPEDLQQIIIEEGARTELEGLRLSPFQNVIPVQANQQQGVQPLFFSEEIRKHIQATVLPEYILPGWVRRLRYPGNNEAVVAAYNEKVGPYIGLLINEDGTLAEVPITRGPASR